MDKISYALGLSMGQNLMGSGVEKLNYQDLAAGIEDVLTHAQPKITYQEAQQVLNPRRPPAVCSTRSSNPR